MVASLTRYAIFIFTVLFVSVTGSSAAILFDSGLNGRVDYGLDVIFASKTKTNTVLAQYGSLGSEVLFTGTERLKVKRYKKADKKPDKAAIMAKDKKLNYLEIEALEADKGIDFMQFNLKAKVKKATGAGAKVTLLDQNGNAHIFELDLKRKGDNFYTAQALEGELIIKAIIEADNGVVLKQLKQMRLHTVDLPPSALAVTSSSVDLVTERRDYVDLVDYVKMSDQGLVDAIVPIVTPEPGTLILVGLGGGTLLFVRRRR